MRRYVIIGSGAAGLSAANTLREYDPGGNVTVVTGDRFGYYSRPGLAYLLAGEVDDAQLYPYQPEMLKKLGIDWITAHVEQIDAPAHQLYLKDGRKIHYDRLLLATGATAVIPDLPGIHLEGVVKLDNFEDTYRILRRVQRGKEAIVVGGGITALELVEGFTAQGMRVHYLMRGDRYWSAVLDELESDLVLERLKEDGVMVHTGVQVSEVCGKHAVEGVLTLDGQIIKGRMAAFAVGIRPRLELARSSGISVKRGILVDEYLQTSHADIFAAGDGAEITDPESGKGIMESLWYPARVQGQTAGRNMAGGSEAYQRIFPYNVTRLAGLVTTIIGQVGQEKKEPDRDVNGIMRGDSEGWRMVSEAMVAQNGSGNNRLRLYVGEKVLRGALIMGDQTLSRPLQRLIEDQVDISSIRPALLAPNADLTKIIQLFNKVGHTDVDHAIR